MLFSEGMGPRESIAVMLKDTVFFGDIDRIKESHKGKGYRKMTNKAGKSFYMLPFGRSANCYGFVAIENVKSIVMHYRKNGTYLHKKLNNVTEARRFLIKEFIQ